MRSEIGWTASMAVGVLFAWIVFRPWALGLGGAVALVAAIFAYRSRPKGWRSFRRTLGDLATLNGVATVLGTLALGIPAVQASFPTHEAVEIAVWAHVYSVVFVGAASLLVAAACRMGLW